MRPSSVSICLQSLHRDFIHFVSNLLSCSTVLMFTLKILSNVFLQSSHTKSYSERHIFNMPNMRILKFKLLLLILVTCYTEHHKFLNFMWRIKCKKCCKIIAEPKDPSARIDFMKGRIGIEVGFGHSSFIGIDLLKFQTLSYSNLDKIDVGVYIVVTSGFRKRLCSEYKQKWEGSLTFEKVCRYLPHFRSAIQVPIFVYGLEE